MIKTLEGYKLLPYQIEHTIKLIQNLQKYKGTVDGSITGSGKSFTALAAAKYLGLQPLIIAPKAVLPSWAEVADIMQVKPYGIYNYEALKANKYPVMRFEKGPTRRHNKLTWTAPEGVMIIFDESHVLKSWKTINAHMAYTASMYYPTMALSATLGDKPIHFFSVGHIVKLFDQSNFLDWLDRIEYKTIEFTGVEKFRRRLFGMATKIEVPTTVQEKCLILHKSIILERGSRMNLKDVREYFQDNQVRPELLNMNSHTPMINTVYEHMKRELDKLSQKARNDKICVLTILLRARQKIELLKVPTIIAHVNTLIGEGNSVVVFTNFNETLNALKIGLNTNCFISGENRGTERESNRVAFQEDRERIIIVNIRSGGVGISLHDLHGNYPRVSLICPSYSAQDTLQAIGRISRSMAKSMTIQKIILAKDTMEEIIYKKLKHKVKNIAAINDGDMSEVAI